MTTTEDFLLRPLTTTVGQPLRVAVYSRIARGIRDHVFPLGSPLPRETELCAALGVSRTVVREALMLLEEDGLISTRRGVGRFVAESVPKTGFEVFRPLEQALSDGNAEVAVEVLKFDLQPTTEFVSSHLNLDSAANTWFRESLLRRGDIPIAIVQEHVPAGRYLSDISADFADALPVAAEKAATLPAALAEAVGIGLTGGSFQITAGAVGESRGALLNLDHTDPVVILTQVLEVGGHAAYVCKCIAAAAAGPLAVVQNVAS